jgi:hypothetical protein
MTVDELYEKLVSLIIQGYGKKTVVIYNEIEAPYSIKDVETYTIENDDFFVCITI